MFIKDKKAKHVCLWKLTIISIAKGADCNIEDECFEISWKHKSKSKKFWITIQEEILADESNFENACTHS